MVVLIVALAIGSTGCGKRNLPSSGMPIIVKERSLWNLVSGANTDTIRVSADGNHVSYIAGQGEKTFVVTDAKPDPAYGEIGDGSLLFSPDSRHVAYVAGKSDRWHMVVDGKIGPAYERAGRPVFSADGRHVAYGARKKGKWFVVADEEPSGACGGIASIVFSAEGKRIAYTACDHASTLEATSSFGGSASTIRSQFVVVDGKPGPSYERISDNSPVFSPDSNHIAYIASAAGMEKIVEDGKDSSAYDVVGEGGPVFSADSRHLAYTAAKGGQLFLVVDDKQAIVHDLALDRAPVFSPDGQRIVYFESNGDKWFVAENGAQGPIYDEIDDGTLTFSSDSKHLAYYARQGTNRILVVDGNPCPVHGRILFGSKPVFDGPNALHTVTLRKNTIYRLEITIGSELSPKVQPQMPDVRPRDSIASRLESKINPVDGAEMIWIPAGEFVMGDRRMFNEQVHKVFLEGFYIYKNLVTVAMYKEFCQASSRTMPKAPRWGWGKPDYPMVTVSWPDAVAYCKWAGVALPTEAQWERAARGTDRRRYPWGNHWDPSRCCSNAQEPSPVGSFKSGASPYGVLDMTGNVFQWCADWSDDDYYSYAPKRNPDGPCTGEERAQRGGSWSSDFARMFGSDGRWLSPPEKSSDTVGFRCVAGPE